MVDCENCGESELQEWIIIDDDIIICKECYKALYGQEFIENEADRGKSLTDEAAEGFVEGILSGLF